MFVAFTRANGVLLFFRPLAKLIAHAKGVTSLRVMVMKYDMKWLEKKGKQKGHR